MIASALARGRHLGLPREPTARQGARLRDRHATRTLAEAAPTQLHATTHLASPSAREMTAMDHYDDAPLPVVVHLDGIMVYANHAGHQMARNAGHLGEAESLVGRPIHDFIPSAFIPKAAQVHAAVIEANETVCAFHFDILDHRGETFSILGTAEPILWQGKRAVRVFIQPLAEVLALRHPETHRLGHLSCLSQRERQIALLIAEGCRTAEIAADLGIQISTVRTHLRTIMRKTGTHTRVSLVRWVLG